MNVRAHIDYIRALRRFGVMCEMDWYAYCAWIWSDTQ